MKQRLTLVLALVFVLTPVTQQLAHAQSAGPAVDTGLVTSSQPTQRQEVVGLRTETSRTYREGGHYVAEVSAEPINYRDATGAWQPIDNTLQTSALPGVAFANRANQYTVKFPSSLSAGPVHVDAPGGWVEFALHGGSGPGVASGATDTYPLPGGTVALTAGNTTMKEAITLSGPSSPSTFVYDLATSTGLSAAPNASGGIDFVDATGTTRFSFAPPSMADAAGAASKAVTMTLGQSGGRQTVTVSADRTWLNAPARSWPVTIDPTMVFKSYECEIVSGTGANTNQCGMAWTHVGFDGSLVHRTLVNFDLSFIPQGSVVSDAAFSMDLSSNAPASPTEFDVLPVTRSWSIIGVTWNSATTSTAWSTPGATSHPRPQPPPLSRASRSLLPSRGLQ